MTKNDNQIREKIIQGIDLAHKRLIKEKKARNLDLIISDKGKITRISANNL
jgi:hypothetical protein